MRSLTRIPRLRRPRPAIDASLDRVAARRSTASPARTKARKARSDGSQNRPTRPQPIWDQNPISKNQIRLQSTRGRRTVHASTGESASWAHDERPPSRRSRRCHHGTAVHARTGKRALQAHDVRSPPDYILFQMDQAGSLRPAGEDDRERVRGRRGSPSEEKIRRRQ